MIDPQARFSDEETREIISLAASRQEEADRVKLGGSGGLTLGALEEAARGAGIDPLYVQAAAKDVVLRRGAAPVARRAALRAEVRAQRVVAGSLSDAEWERMVADLRETFGKTGIASQFGEVREWSSGNAPSEMPVTIRFEPLDEGTLITLHQPTMAMSSVLYSVGGTTGGMAALLAILFAMGDFAASMMFLPLMIAGLGALGTGGAWLGYRAQIQRQEERFRAVLDRAELLARGR